MSEDNQKILEEIYQVDNMDKMKYNNGRVCIKRTCVFIPAYYFVIVLIVVICNRD